MKEFMPDTYQKNIYTINYEKLKEENIKCLLFDLDNTLASKNMKKPTEELKELVKKLKEMGFTVMIFSNASKKRLAPFKDELDIRVVSRVFKPYQFNYHKFMKSVDFKKEEIACIGDQLLTDVKGGNNFGFKTIFLDPILNSDQLITLPNRLREKKIIKKLEENKQFKKGSYYDKRE